jgi:Subtilase family
MHRKETRHARWLVLMVCSVTVALGMLLLVTSERSPTRLPEAPAHPTVTRQRVVIFIVDTLDYFDAHGTYVQSVVQQQCAACELQLVNLHGDLSILALVHALDYVQTVHQTYAASTTSLVNLSLGTYIYDEALHTSVHALDTAGIPIIASAGNDNTSKPFYPAAFPEVLGVCSSTRHTRVKAAYSNFGPWVSLCAPGLQYVTRPLQHGDIASGTSFASPMVAGTLGQLLLDAPCASPRAGLRALRRTADPPAENQPALGAGILNSTTAGQYLRSLYTCQSPPGMWQRRLARLQRLGTGLATYVGLVVYFFVSIFAVPFFLAFVIDKLEQRAAQRQAEAMQRAYAGSPDYRQQRLLALKHTFRRTHKVRRRERAELAALLQALHLYGEPCWWCEAAAPEPYTGDWNPTDVLQQCSRCGWEIAAPSRLLADEGDSAASS